MSEISGLFVSSDDAADVLSVRAGTKCCTSGKSARGGVEAGGISSEA